MSTIEAPGRLPVWAWTLAHGAPPSAATDRDTERSHGGRATGSPRRRFGVIDFVQLHLPFVPRVAQLLSERAEFLYLQPRTDAAALKGHEQRLWVLEDTPPTPLDLDDAELLRICGRHQCMKWNSIPQLLRHARLAIERIETFLQQSGVDCLLLWNGATLMSALARDRAARRGLGLLYFENGYLPGTMQIAVEGVNAFNEHARDIAAGAYRDYRCNERALDEALTRLRSGRRPADAVVPRKPGPTPARRLVRELTRLFRPSAWRWTRTLGRGRFHRMLPATVDRFVLLPLQSVKDSQLHLHSPLVGNDMPRLVLETYLAMRQALPGHRLVVKLHPKESSYRRRLYLDVMRKLPEVVFLEGSTMRELLPRCDVLVTVNSTAGVEALAFDRPVVALGRNFYVTPELVEVVRSWDELPGALGRAVRRTGPEAAEMRRRFLGYLHQRVMTPGSHLDLSARSVEALAQRIWALAQESGR